MRHKSTVESFRSKQFRLSTRFKAVNHLIYSFHFFWNYVFFSRSTTTCSILVFLVLTTCMSDYVYIPAMAPSFAIIASSSLLFWKQTLKEDFHGHCTWIIKVSHIGKKFSEQFAQLNAINQLGKYCERDAVHNNILLLTNHAGKNEIIAPKELIIAQVAKPRGQ